MSTQPERIISEAVISSLEQSLEALLLEVKPLEDQIKTYSEVPNLVQEKLSALREHLRVKEVSICNVAKTLDLFKNKLTKEAVEKYYEKRNLWNENLMTKVSEYCKFEFEDKASLDYLSQLSNNELADFNRLGLITTKDIDEAISRR